VAPPSGSQVNVVAGAHNGILYPISENAVTFIGWLFLDGSVIYSLLLLFSANVNKMTSSYMLAII